MKSFELCEVIRSLRPGAEFTFTNKDYSTIEWIKLDGEAPTQEEIDAEYLIFKAKVETEKEAADAKRSLAISKLEALGLDEGDLRALGL